MSIKGKIEKQVYNMQYVKFDCVVVLLNISQGPALTTEYF